MNDPNGLIFHNGTYHLFYQHHPHSLKWGPMHWGHAVSKDLITWENRPIALFPDDAGYVFSGSAVIDIHNRAGFGAGAMIAIYSTHIPQSDDSAIQAQAIAYSLDDGCSWTKYSGNPVIPMPDLGGHNEFRDPKVEWFGTPEAGHWTMVLSVKDEVWIYTSPDLKSWTLGSTFGRGLGCHGGVWECPDLFEIEVEGTGKTAWLMLVSVQNGAPSGGNGVQYFVGDFDGNTFTPFETDPPTRWVDYGPDFYAAVTYNHEPNGRRILVGWMNNWPYSHDIPAEIWRGMQSVPRELFLVQTGSKTRLVQRPVAELDSYWIQVINGNGHLLDGAGGVCGGRG